MIEVKNVTFQYPKSDRKVLNDLEVCFQKGVLYAVTGPSGTGKSTLLSVLSGIETPRKGEVLIDGQPVDKDSIRRQNIGFIFQDYMLFPYLTALENVEIAIDIRDPENRDRRASARSQLLALGLTDGELNRKVRKLSGGEQQRVAIARTLAIGAEYILADEPTGNLDEDTADRIIQKLADIAHEQQKCVIVVTHSERVRDAADVVFTLEYGVLHEYGMLHEQAVSQSLPPT